MLKQTHKTTPVQSIVFKNICLDNRKTNAAKAC